jgi:hypothetical protein
VDSNLREELRSLMTGIAIFNSAMHECYEQHPNDKDLLRATLTRGTILAATLNDIVARVTREKLEGEIHV